MNLKLILAAYLHLVFLTKKTQINVFFFRFFVKILFGIYQKVQLIQLNSFLKTNFLKSACFSNGTLLKYFLDNLPLKVNYYFFAQAKRLKRKMLSWKEKLIFLFQKKTKKKTKTRKIYFYGPRWRFVDMFDHLEETKTETIVFPFIYFVTLYLKCRQMENLAHLLDVWNKLDLKWYYFKFPFAICFFKLK